MAQSLDLQVIAEGVETVAQLRAVADAGCGLAQGYLFTPPLDCSSAGILLQDLAAPAFAASRTPDA
jgi:EAL domain-containing protein (putative c-di-GMP-specific phosphodiesterase class I)